jgi:hypothetical protein
MTKRYGNYFLVFRNGGEYQEIQNGKIRDENQTYKIDEGKKVIKIKSNTVEWKSAHEMYYEFQDQHLKLTIPDLTKENMMILFLEKVN